MREVKLEKLEIIGFGGCSTIYRAGDEAIIKIYSKNITPDGVENIKKITDKLYALGIPVMRSYEVVRAGECYGIVSELLGAGTVADAVMKDPSLTDEYARKMGTLLKRLHRTEVPEGIFPVFKDRLFEWVDIMEREHDIKRTTARCMRQMIEAMPDTDTLLHCDFHEGNVMLRGSELVLTDIDEVCTGNPLYDLSFIYCNHYLLSYQPKILKKSVGLDPKSAVRMRSVMMKEYYGAEDDRFFRKADKLFLMIGYLTEGLSPARVGESEYFTSFNRWLMDL